MHGIIAHMRPTASHEQQIQDLLDQWNRERKTERQGQRRRYLLRTDRDPSAVIFAAVYESRETYQTNRDNPEQDRSLVPPVA